MNYLKYISEKNDNSSVFFIDTIKISLLDKGLDKKKIKNAIQISLSKIPHHLKTEVDEILIGKNSHLEKRNFQGMYQNGKIFLAGDHKKEKDIIDDLVHEFSHSIEKKYNSDLYGDDKLKNEFLQKRKQLYSKLKNFQISKNIFFDVRYNVEFDEFLYLKVGYKKLASMTSNIFYSPYAATSLREYFANGFEAFYMKEDVYRLKKISPILFKKIVFLNDQKKGEKINEK